MGTTVASGVCIYVHCNPITHFDAFGLSDQNRPEVFAPQYGLDANYGTSDYVNYTEYNTGTIGGAVDLTVESAGIASSPAVGIGEVVAGMEAPAPRSVPEMAGRQFGRDFAENAGKVEVAVGLAQMAAGSGMEGGGMMAAPVTSGASLTVSATGVAVEAGGALQVAVGGTLVNNAQGLPPLRMESSSGGPKNGETPATRKGRQAHKDWDPGKGFEKEVKLPSGKRADGVNFEQKHVKELKPNNSRAVNRGEKQVEQYRQELQDEHGGDWTSSVETYE